MTSLADMKQALLKVDVELELIQRELDTLHERQRVLKEEREKLLTRLVDPTPIKSPPVTILPSGLPATSSSSVSLSRTDSSVHAPTGPTVNDPAFASDDPAHFPWSRELPVLANRYWHIKEFRPLQRDVMNATLSGLDVFVILSTGSGKSLCFQLPALLNDGLTVVISPLLSLIIDQVYFLSSI